MPLHDDPTSPPSADTGRLGPALPNSRLAPLIGLLAGKRLKFIPLLVGLLVSIALLGLGGEAATTSDPTAGMPAGAESTEAVRLQQRLPDARTQPAIVVYSRPGGSLTAADQRAIEAQRASLEKVADGDVGQPVLSPGDRAALVSVPLDSVPAGGGGEGSEEQEQAVLDIREAVAKDLPDGARAQVTGPAAFQVDLGKVFDGADGRLLGATALVVALLLLITYRSPWLWLVPLIVIGLADRVVASLIAILSRNAGLVSDGATTGIVSVLVFGAGTNYALLLVARYREELRRHEHRHTAMRAALTHAAPAILASSTTVALSLATLAFADLPFDRNIGIAGAIGIATAVIFVLGMLPPALLLFGRRLFWPLVPRVGDHDPSSDGIWAKIGGAVTKRPAIVSTVTVALLVVFALGSIGSSVGLSQTEQLRDRPDSVLGQETIAKTFGPGSGQPTPILVRADQSQRATEVAQGTPGVTRVTPGPRGDGYAQLDAQFDAEPSSDGAFATVRALRDRLSDVPGDPKVGGQSASDLDDKAAAAGDRKLVVPLILVVVLGVLLLLLRSIVAAVLLALTNVLSWAAALGASTWAFEHVFGFPGVDLAVPLLSFLFLVALGVDYNIFLITRAREEVARASTRASIITALATTGGVITSAGILLAAVFAVLGVLPVITLTQIGIVVGFGILVDTLLVRTVLVPAMVTLLGERFWWPGTPRKAEGHAEAPAR